MISSDSISILGCGWLGLPLAKDLLNKNIKVKGSTTSSSKLETLQHLGIEPFLIHVDGSTPIEETSFFDTDILIINIPPRRTSDVVERYPKQIRNIIQAANAAGTKKVVFVSSTSVYPSENKVATENTICTPDKDSGKALIAAEEIVKNIFHGSWSILRFCGLMGPMRSPGRFFQGKSNIPGGLAPVNYIHLDDCIGIIETIIEKKLWNKIYNGCADKHPSKIYFYTKAAQKQDLPVPEFRRETGQYKEISNDLIKKESGYTFVHPDPINAL